VIRLLRRLLASFERPEVRWHMPDDVVTWDNIRPGGVAWVGIDRSPYQQGRDEERAAVIAGLRAAAAANPDSIPGAYALYFAEFIEAGEHLAAPESRDGGAG
jgi:hypothetical protein